MTRFSGDAVSVRGGGNKLLGKKDLAKNMEKFKQTGVHPDIQKARERAAADTLPTLPEHDANRDFVFLDLLLGQSTPLGRLVVELFADHVTVGAHHLRNRCLPGSKTGLQGAQVHKLQPNFAMWFGKNPAASEGVRLPAHPKFKHVDAGCVSVSLNGDEVAISLGRALALDSTHQVVGRVHRGLDILEKLCDLQVNNMDVPNTRVTVVKCGPTNASGAHEELQGAEGAEATKDPLQRLAEQSKDARNAVKQALAEGLKRKAGEPGSQQGTGDKAAAPQGKGGAGPVPPAAKKGKFMDMGLLGDDEDDDQDSDSADGDAEEEEGKQ